MRPFPRETISALLVLLLLALTTAKPKTKTQQQDSAVCSEGDGTCSSTRHLEECGIWLAPSSLPGAGLGMYAGRDFAKKEPLQETGDIVIPIVDIMMHQRGRGRWVFVWDEYTWNGKSLGLGHEVIKEINAASPGFGSAANSFLDLVNVDEGDPINTMPSGLHRSRDPGVGAFSTYNDRRSTAKVKIKSGQELFVNYGQHWFEQRIRLGPIPLRRGLKQSTNLYRRFQMFRDKNPQVDSKVFGALWEEFVKHTVYNESRILGAFYNTPSELEMLDRNMTLKQIRVHEGTRTKQWLFDHGTCADHIRADVSTIRQAGRGAFATRDLPNGAIVSSLPLIQIINKNVLEMYELKDIKTRKLEQRRRVGYQLLLNYCYGHVNSTMLLCPYGPIVNMVNHNQTRANVKLRWSDPERGNHEPGMLQQPIDTFSEDRTTKLSMDLVAIRDIKKDEEILLDYGDDWEKAWQEHVKSWNITDADKYISAFMLNQEENTTSLRTEFEQLSDPYPGNVNLECDLNIWEGINKTLFNTTLVINITSTDDWEYYPCEVLRRRVVNGTTLYTISMTRPPKEKKKDIKVPADSVPKNLKLSDVPRMAMRFTDRPYTSDMFLKEAFRHHIGIPDSMFPLEWMNYSPI
ncbi:Guanylate cyclase [Seminavis robusta]|uniref:Guanylate cyclase n=1 Tax=Seminavis robusta TaxID=568900 RepID=A0A9N8DGP5_9STRA|nr:Guanylate cyclase [Seminavis robusta]|eukprot:Sro111_g055230.1 Guanylate cyclase (631) ;mRNA; f:42805-44969